MATFAPGSQSFATLRTFNSVTQAPESRRTEAVVVVADTEAPTIACGARLATRDGRWEENGAVRVGMERVCFHRVPIRASLGALPPSWELGEVAYDRFQDRPRFLKIQATFAESSQPVGETDTGREANSPQRPSSSGLQTTLTTSAPRPRFNLAAELDEDAEADYDEGDEEEVDIYINVMRMAAD